MFELSRELTANITVSPPTRPRYIRMISTILERPHKVEVTPQR